jgi:hypothetical protein
VAFVHFKAGRPDIHIILKTPGPCERDILKKCATAAFEVVGEPSPRSRRVWVRSTDHVHGFINYCLRTGRRSLKQSELPPGNCVYQLVYKTKGWKKVFSRPEPDTIIESPTTGRRVTCSQPFHPPPQPLSRPVNVFSNSRHSVRPTPRCRSP